MRFIAYKPFSHNQVPTRNFPTSQRTFVPRANVLKKEEGYEIELAVPGFSKSDFEIRLEAEVLHISGKRTGEEKDQYARREFGISSFERRFIVPDTIVGAEIQARYENGVLRVLLPEKKVAPRRVEVA
ncbi:MAG: Hsp20/alpha crystallin family protein [Saprospirales bacterium]|nr:Hsp20/alpha crystallin family protein [Saprospirales bacterium]